MVIGKRNTLNGVGLIPLGWLPPLKGLASLGVTPESSGVNYGGRLLDRFVLSRGVFPEILEGHNRPRYKGILVIQGWGHPDFTGDAI